MARILVLGGAGFIGGHLAARLAAEGHALTLVDDLSRGRRDATIEALIARPNVALVEAKKSVSPRPGIQSRRWSSARVFTRITRAGSVSTFRTPTTAASM